MSANVCSPSWFSRFAENDTGISCPTCGKQNLVTRFTCFDAEFFCHSCDGYFSLSKLFRKVSDNDFESLAGMIDDRFSDRI